LQYFLQTHPDVWEGLKAQGADIYDTRFSQFLANHPEVAAHLRDDPESLYDPDYRNNHPALAQFLAAHPRVWANLNAQHEAAGPAQGELGAYDNSTDGMTPTGGIRTIPIGSGSIIRSGLQSIRNGATRTAPTTGSISGTTANGGLSRIRIG
jgi:hypothetical protein